MNNDEKCARLEQENVELRAALADKLVSQTLLKRLVAESGQLKMEMEGGACRLMAEAFGAMLQDSGAVNYIETTFEVGGADDLPGAGVIVTVQREEGLTPHQLRLQAEQERDAHCEVIYALQLGMPIVSKWPTWANYCALGPRAYWSYFATMPEIGVYDFIPNGGMKGVAGAATEEAGSVWRPIIVGRSRLEAKPSCFSDLPAQSEVDNKE